MPDNNSCMSRSPTSNDNLRFIRREACLFPGFKIDCILEFAPICHQLLSFELFWQFPVKRLQVEILSHQIHVGDNLRKLKSNALGCGVLQCLVHQRQNGLVGLQSDPCVSESFGFRALTGSTKAVAAAAATWVLGIKSEFARPAPVTVDAFHIHLTRALPSLSAAGAHFSL